MLSKTPKLITLVRIRAKPLQCHMQSGPMCTGKLQHFNCTDLYWNYKAIAQMQKGRTISYISGMVCIQGWIDRGFCSTAFLSLLQPPICRSYHVIHSWYEDWSTYSIKIPKPSDFSLKKHSENNAWFTSCSLSIMPSFFHCYGFHALCLSHKPISTIFSHVWQDICAAESFPKTQLLWREPI